jgi:hypothetical protein
VAELDAQTAGADARWAEAGLYAQGFADNGIGEALRVYYTRYFPAGVVLYIGALALVGPLLSGDEPTKWRFILQVGAVLFALLAAITGFTYNAKRIKPRGELGKNLSLTIGLEAEEQKYVKRVINGKEPPPQDPVRLAVIRSVAVQARKNNATNLLVVPMYSYCLGSIPGNLFIFWIIASALFVLAAILLFRDFRRAGRFLAATELRA